MPGDKGQGDFVTTPGSGSVLRATVEARGLGGPRPLQPSPAGGSPRRSGTNPQLPAPRPTRAPLSLASWKSTSLPL